MRRLHRQRVVRHNQQPVHRPAYWQAFAGALACVAVALSGCAGISAAPSIHTYQLAIEPSTDSSERLPVVVLVAPFHSASVYDGEEIVYREAASSLGRYHYHRWAVRPARLLADLLTGDLVHSQRYKAVAQAPSPLASDYNVHVSLEQIEEAPAADGCSARLQLSAVLTRTQAGSDPIVYQKTYSADFPAPCQSPAELVVAMGGATTEVLQKLQRDVGDAIAEDLRAGRSGKD